MAYPKGNYGYVRTLITRRHITGIDARLSHKFQNMRELRCRLEHTTETYLTGEQEFPTTLLGGKAGAPAAEGKKDPSMA